MPAFNSYERIIRAGLKDAGLLADGADPTAEQFADCLNAINDIINFEQTQGLKLWLDTDLSIPLVAGTALYTLGPGGSVNMTKPLRVIQAYYLSTNAIRSPLTPISREEYTRLSVVTTQGAINSYFVDKQQLLLNVYFWLTPDTQAATGTAHLIIQQQAGNAAAISDSVSFPQEWFMFLRWALADEKSTGQPKAIMDRCKERAGYYREALEDWDVEDASTQFTPDSRQTNTAGRFR